MKNSLQITLKDAAVIKLEATVKKTSDTLLKVFELHPETPPYFLWLNITKSTLFCHWTN
jgi:hypothetical protein